MNLIKWKILFTDPLLHALPFIILTAGKMPEAFQFYLSYYQESILSYANHFPSLLKLVHLSFFPFKAKPILLNKLLNSVTAYLFRSTYPSAFLHPRHTYCFGESSYVRLLHTCSYKLQFSPPSLNISMPSRSMAANTSFSIS